MARDTSDGLTDAPIPIAICWLTLVFLAGLLGGIVGWLLRGAV